MLFFHRHTAGSSRRDCVLLEKTVLFFKLVFLKKKTTTKYFANTSKFECFSSHALRRWLFLCFFIIFPLNLLVFSAEISFAGPLFEFVIVCREEAEGRSRLSERGVFELSGVPMRRYKPTIRGDTYQGWALAASSGISECLPVTGHPSIPPLAYC